MHFFTHVAVKQLGILSGNQLVFIYLSNGYVIGFEPELKGKHHAAKSCMALLLDRVMH